MTKNQHPRAPLLFAISLVATLVGVSLLDFRSAEQTSSPVLVSHADSTRAVVFESVTRKREPFSTTAEVRFGPDGQTRIMLFAMNLTLQAGDSASAVTAEAEDASHQVYQLAVESVAVVQDQPWATSI